ncbi:DNA-processing protein DprA [Chryseobacterium sp. ERMR1:04]|uniref:DNA-processing protein DprA n=1 Tax=Chryseobacterium sp. ERMR1:04 TaxID=1705393 RepID=UPI0006C85AD4|nr:DNA-processing protein DprA [Chryseobacterium sp. ERMR1:04]KPH11849.1 DNA-binding protein [Chryseobacterium sp. ERMR1:04]
MLVFKEANKRFINYLSPVEEMIAYEAIWDNYDKASFKKLSQFFIERDHKLPTQLVDCKKVEDYRSTLLKIMKDHDFGIVVNHTLNYPEKLKDAKEPLEVFYYKGNLELLRGKSLAIVGSRKASEEGLKRTRMIVRELVKNNITIASGLAEGIDTMAHLSALHYQGNTFAVIGTPINQYYPKKNKNLQDYLAKQFLVVSQVPFIKYSKQGIQGNRLFFPERNKTMSALTEGTIIVEAGETSGSLIQAKAAIAQGRKLFILESCFNNKNISWPSKFEEQGAIRVKKMSDIIDNI